MTATTIASHFREPVATAGAARNHVTPSGALWRALPTHWTRLGDARPEARRLRAEARALERRARRSPGERPGLLDAARLRAEAADILDQLGSAGVS
jgi:hypothetical protein